MKFFAAIQTVLDAGKGEAYRDEHVEFLERLVGDGRIFARGRFLDGSGGLTIFEAQSLEDARKAAESDPYVIHGVRRLEIHEWDMKIKH
ncbi:MAG: YciI family protein [Candidatus Acidiferrales bacterium]